MLFKIFVFEKRHQCNLLLAITLLLCLKNTNTIAQSKIRGKVIDGAGNALANANVLLLNAEDSSLVKGFVTSASGSYIFDSKRTGKYLITSTYTGYTQVYTPEFIINSNGENVEVGTITLAENSTELSAVSVTITKPLFEQKIDRMIINVRNSITAVGSTVLDILERSPGVIVDRQNNVITMSGKNGVVVMINGKINHMPFSAILQLLSGMNSANVEKIELITTPPANLDAEGNAGFINIVLVDDPSFGTNGSYSATIGYGRGATTLTGINFNHRNGKINFNGDISFSRIEARQTFSFYRKVNYNSKVTESNTVSDRDPVTTNYNGRLGFDYQVTAKTTVGAEISAYDDAFRMHADNTNDIFINRQLDTLIKVNNQDLDHWSKCGGSLNLLHTNHREKISFEVDYDSYRNNNPNNYSNTYYSGTGDSLYNQQTNSGKVTVINIFVGSLEYSNKLNDNLSIDAGVKASSYGFTNDVSVSKFVLGQWIPDNNLTTSYRLREDIPAAYSSLNVTIDEKNSMKLGLRYEYTNTNLGMPMHEDIIDKHYGKFFPSFFATHKFNDNNAVNVSYTQRITRPTFNDLAPFVLFLDPNTFISGNSELQPSISNSVSVTWLLKQFLFSASYNNEKNYIASFQTSVDSVINKEYLISQNLPSLKTIALNIAMPFTVTNWWNMQNNIIGRWQRVNAIFNSKPFTVEQENLTINSTQTFTLPKDFSVEAQGYYRSGSIFGTSVAKAIGALNIGVQKKLKDNKSKFTFKISDVFNTLVVKISNNFPEQNLVTHGNFQFVPRTFSLIFTHNFGNKNLKANREKSAAAEEGRTRVEKKF